MIKYILKGKVIDAKTGVGIGGVWIKFLDHETVSNWDGSYHIVVKEPYKGYVVASKRGYVPQEKYVELMPYPPETILNFELRELPPPPPPPPKPNILPLVLIIGGIALIGLIARR